MHSLPSPCANLINNLYCSSRDALRHQLYIDMLDIWLPVSNLKYVNLNDGVLGILGYVVCFPLQCFLPINPPLVLSRRSSDGRNNGLRLMEGSSLIVAYFSILYDITYSYLCRSPSVLDSAHIRSRRIRNRGILLRLTQKSELHTRPSKNNNGYMSSRQISQIASS